ncbi:MAG: hypothetical protein QNL33_09665 [Akkermansiaceae bacterium]
MKIPKIFLFGLIAGSTLAPAAPIRDLTLATLEHSYLLDSDEFDADPATNRHTAETTFDAHFETSATEPNHGGWYRVAYRLKDENGTLLDLVNGDAAHPTQPNKWAYSDIGLVFIIGPGSQDLTFEAFPDPVATLESKTRHQVEGYLQVRTSTNPDVWENVTYPLGPFTISERISTPLSQFLHFTNTVSGDAEYNAPPSIRLPPPGNR